MWSSHPIRTVTVLCFLVSASTDARWKRDGGRLLLDSAGDHEEHDCEHHEPAGPPLHAESESDAFASTFLATGCSSIFVPDAKDWRETKFLNKCRLLEEQVALSLSQKFSVWKDWKSFRSPDEMLQELQDPSAEYTVLIPPKSDLQRLNDAIETGYLQREDARGSLLKHILLGRHTLADFKSIPNDGITLSAVTGEPMLFKWEEASGRIAISSSDKRLLAYLIFYEKESCKENCTIIEVSELLQDRCLYNSLSEFAHSGHSRDRDAVLDNTHEKPPDAAVSLLFIIFPGVIVLLGCGYIAWMKATGARAAHAAVEGAGMIGKDEEVCSDPRQPPKELHRVDVLRWSTSPPVATSAAQNPSTQAAPTPQASSAQRLSFTVQKSYPSEGVDTCGLRQATACVICYEREGDHVLLPCGHGGYCGNCAHTLLYQPNRFRLCPICRARLGSVVKIDLDTPVGTSGKVLEASVGLVEPSSESAELGQWQALVQATWSTDTRAQTFPPETVGRVARARGTAAARSGAYDFAALNVSQGRPNDTVSGVLT